MHAQQLLARRFRRVVALQKIQQPGGGQPILDGMDPRRAFRVVLAHVVLEAERVGDVGSLHVNDPAQIKYHVRPEVSKGKRYKIRGFDTSARTEMKRLLVPDQ